MNLLDTLDDLHGKATPGEWMHNQFYEMAHTHSAIHKLTPLLMYHPRNDRAAADMAHAVALHNAWPAISRALRAAANLDAFVRDVTRPHEPLTPEYTELREALEGLVKP